MEIRLAVRHFEPQAGFHEEVEDKLNSVIQKYFSRVLESDAVFSLENNRFSGEANVKIKGTSFHAHDEDHNLHQCIEKVVKKLETQMRRYKDKKISMKKKPKRDGGADENS